jgi:hypothetical protein
MDVAMSTDLYHETTLAGYNLAHGTNFTHMLMPDAMDDSGKRMLRRPQIGTLPNSGLDFGPGVLDTELPNVTCFVRGTMIETDCGPVAIEELQCGDRIETLDHGFQAVRWIGSRRIMADELAANPQLLPVRISVGALGRGLPEADVLISPQHRVLVVSQIAERMFGSPEVLVAARQLVEIDGIDLAEDVDFVEYFHFLLDRHQIVYAEGAPMESMHVGIEALTTVSEATKREIFELFPELMSMAPEELPAPIRPIQVGHMARKMASLHATNNTKLVARL